MRCATPTPTAPPHTCPPPGPDRPQVPVPIPATPPPDWSGTVMARTEAPWYLPLGVMSLRIARPVGAADGYGTWVDATTAARAEAPRARTAIAVLDHRGRLYLRTIDVPPLGGVGLPSAYDPGVRGDRAIRFHDDAIRGIVTARVTIGRGDCLHERVELPPARDTSRAGARQAAGGALAIGLD